MSIRSYIALALLGAAGTAAAATVDTLEIDFTVGTPVPLSPWLAAIVAVALGLAALALLKRQGTQRMLLLGAAAIVASGVFVLPRTTDAAPPLSLQSSPTLVPVSCGGNPHPFFRNVTGQPITLTKVSLSGQLGTTLNGGACQVGAHLAPNVDCDLFVLFPQSCQGT